MPDASRYSPTAAFWSGKRVLVTGHTGFKGSWLLVWLTTLGAKVRGYALAPHTDPSIYRALALDEVCDSVIADIRDRDRLAHVVGEFRPQIAIHMAAQPLVRRSYAAPLDTFEINVQGTANFLEACRQVKELRAVVVVTSDKCYENKEWSRGYCEDDALGGHDPYSASKACAELVVAAFRRSFLTERPAVATARAGNVIGGGDWSADRIIADAVRAFAAGQPLAVRSPEAIRPWQHVTQPLLGYLTLARALHDSGSEFALGYNFGPSANRSLAVREVVEQAVSAWGDGASWQDRSDPDTPHEAGTLELDSTRAGQMLDWRPLDDITRSIEATVEWYRAFYRHEAVEDMRELTRRQIRELASLPLS